jgi:hypothetical protein
MLSSSWDTVFSIQSSPANGVRATDMTCHFSQRILTLTDLVGAETSCLEAASICLAAPRSTALVAAALRSGQHFDAQPLSQEHHQPNVYAHGAFSGTAPRRPTSHEKH